MAKTLPAVPIIVVISIMVFMILGLFIWAIYNYQQLNSKAANLVQNPYCIRFACPNGTEKEAYKLTPEEDPQQTAYQTINYCTVNAPPEQFQEQVQVCSFGESQEYTDLFIDWLDWYPFKYMPACGYTWKTQNPILTTSTDINSPDNPNNPDPSIGLNGLHDSLAVSAVSCADKLGITSTPGGGLAKLKELIS